jgi:putative phage-type endonuclease
MNTVPCTQGSPEWFQTRCGRVTASRIADVMAKLKNGGESASRAKLKMQLVAERLTQTMTENYVSPAMEWGITNEPLARTEYEMRTEQDVRVVGFVLHPVIEWSGASPDGCVGADGLIEIKCPNTVTHLDYYIAGVPPKEYQPQMLWQMACTGRAWCDFVSYDPRLPEKWRLFIVRFERDEQRIAEMEAEVRKFLGEVEETLKTLGGENQDYVHGALHDDLAQSFSRL